MRKIYTRPDLHQLPHHLSQRVQNPIPEDDDEEEEWLWDQTQGCSPAGLTEEPVLSPGLSLTFRWDVSGYLP